MKSIALINGKIYVQRDVFAQAVYAEDGVIRLVGTNEEIQAAVEPELIISPELKEMEEI